MARPRVYVTRRIPQAGIDLLRETCHVEVNPEDRPLTRFDNCQKGNLVRRQIKGHAAGNATMGTQNPRSGQLPGHLGQITRRLAQLLRHEPWGDGTSCGIQSQVNQSPDR